MKQLFLILLVGISTSLFQLAQAGEIDSKRPIESSLTSRGKVNINSANAKTLAAMLKGVGASKAQAIIDYRRKYGDFEHVSELAEVTGIGHAILKKNSDRIAVE